MLSAAMASGAEYVVDNDVPFIDLNVASNYVNGAKPAHFATAEGYGDTITVRPSSGRVQALALTANPSYVGSIDADDSHNLYYSAKNGSWWASAYVRTLAGFEGQVLNAFPRNQLVFDPEDASAAVPQIDLSMGLQLSARGAGRTLEIGKASAVGQFDLNRRDVTAATAADISIADPLFGVRSDLLHAYGRLTLAAGDHSEGEVVGDPYLHFDATDNASMATVEADGKTYVTRLNDVRGEGYPYAVKSVDAFRPWLATDAATGRQVLDFGGSYCDYGWPVDNCAAGRRTGGYMGIAVPAPGKTAWLKLNAKCSAIREVFVVFREAHIYNCQAHFLGNDNLDDNAFRRGFYDEATSGGKYAGAYLQAGRLFRRRRTVGSGFHDDTSLVQRGDVRLDGQRVQADLAVSLADRLHVLSAGLPGAAVADRIGDNGLGTCASATRYWAVGGFTLGEMLIYTNSLTSAERRRVNNYLKRKWGAGEDREDVDFGSATVFATSELVVPEGHALKVKKSAIREKVVKSGGGTLDLGLPETDAFSVEVKAGELAFSKIFEPPSAIPAGPAPNSDVWVDADNTDTLVLSNAEAAASSVYVLRANHCENGGTNSAGHIAWAARYSADRSFPTRVVDPAARGRWVFDFGPYNWDYQTKDASTSMVINKQVPQSTEVKPKLDTLNNNMLTRSGFIVFRTSKPPDVILGGTSVAYTRDQSQRGYLLNPTTDVTGELAYERFTLDGVKIDPISTPIPEGAYHVLGYRFSAPRRLIETAGHGNQQTGGTRVGEWISYDRELTDQEFRDTEAYLMNKWLGKAHPDVATATGGRTVSVRSLTLGAGAKFSTDYAMTVGALASASGAFTKGGSGQVAVCGVSQNINDIAVEAGSLAVDASLEGLMAGAYFRFDASDAATVTTNAQGEVVEWRDKNGNGFTARPLSNETFVVGHAPKRITETINGHDRPAMDLGDICYPQKAENRYVTTNSACAFELVKPDGTTGPSEALREYFVVYKDKLTTRGASEAVFFTHSPAFGGYDDTTCSLNDELGCYHRHPCYQKNDERRGANNGRYQQLLDGEEITYNYRMGEHGKGGSYHVLSYSVLTNSADWLFRIRQIGGDLWPLNKDYAILGGQNVCEIMCFTEPMSYENRTNVTHYLMKKWLSRTGCEPPARAVAKITVAAGAHFTGDFSGWSGTSVGALGGGGTVKMDDIAGVRAIEAAADADGAFACTKVAGTVAFADAVTVRLAVADETKLEKGSYPILAAGSLLNAVPRHFKVEAPPSRRFCFGLSVEGGTIRLNVMSAGTLIVVK